MIIRPQTLSTQGVDLIIKTDSLRYKILHLKAYPLAYLSSPEVYVYCSVLYI